MKIKYISGLFIIITLLFTNMFADNIKNESRDSHTTASAKISVCQLKAFIDKLKMIEEQISAFEKGARINNTTDNKKINESIIFVLKQLCPDIKFIPAEKSELCNDCKKQYKAEPLPYRGVIISKNKIFYIRIDCFNDKTCCQLSEDLRSVSRLSMHPMGIIIDLRNALLCSRNYKSLNKIIRTISDTKLFSAANWPKIILTGKKTKGDAEIFIQTMKQRSARLITLGETTAGTPFPYKKIVLEDGTKLLLPDISDKYPFISLSPIKPDISEKAYPQLPYSSIADDTAGEKKDNTVEYACELLICLNKIVKVKK